MDEDDGPPRLPGGKFHMTPLGNERLKVGFAALRSDRHRVVELVSWVASNGVCGENADCKEGKRRPRFLINPVAHAEAVDPSTQARRDRIFFGATGTN